jgi:hypothetical protein
MHVAFRVLGGSNVPDSVNSDVWQPVGELSWQKYIPYPPWLADQPVLTQVLFFFFFFKEFVEISKK